MSDDRLRALGAALAEVVADVLRTELRTIAQAPPAAPVSDEILRVDQVAAELQVRPASVRAWIRSGKLRSVALGEAGKRVVYRIRRSDLNAFLAGQTAEPTARDIDNEACKVLSLGRRR